MLNASGLGADWHIASVKRTDTTLTVEAVLPSSTQKLMDGLKAYDRQILRRHGDPDLRRRALHQHQRTTTVNNIASPRTDAAGIEQLIQARGKTAARVKPADIATKAPKKYAMQRVRIG